MRQGIYLIICPKVHVTSTICHFLYCNWTYALSFLCQLIISQNLSFQLISAPNATYLFEICLLITFNTTSMFFLNPLFCQHLSQLKSSQLNTVSLTTLELSWGLELQYSHTFECSDTAIIIFTRTAVHIIVKMLNTHDEFGTYRIYSTRIPANEAMKETVDKNNPNRPLKSTQNIILVMAWNSFNIALK